MQNFVPAGMVPLDLFNYLALIFFVFCLRMVKMGRWSVLVLPAVKTTAILRRAIRETRVSLRVMGALLRTSLKPSEHHDSKVLNVSMRIFNRWTVFRKMFASRIEDVKICSPSCRWCACVVFVCRPCEWCVRARCVGACLKRVYRCTTCDWVRKPIFYTRPEMCEISRKKSVYRCYLNYYLLF